MMRFVATLLIALFALTLAACDEPAEDQPAAPQEADEIDEDDDLDEADETSEADDEAHHGDDDEHELADDLDPGDSGHYGADFSIESAPISLAEAVAQIDDDTGATPDPVKVESRVNYVCEKRGCWMSLETDEVDIPVRVRMKDYAFFVPRNTTGADAVIEGQLQEATLSEEEVQHYADHISDATGEEFDVDGEQQTYKFFATGISMSLPDSP